MKKTVFAIFIISLFFISSPAFADPEVQREIQSGYIYYLAGGGDQGGIEFEDFQVSEDFNGFYATDAPIITIYMNGYSILGSDSTNVYLYAPLTVRDYHTEVTIIGDLNVSAKVSKPISTGGITVNTAAILTINGNVNVTTTETPGAGTSYFGINAFDAGKLYINGNTSLNIETTKTIGLQATATTDAITLIQMRSADNNLYTLTVKSISELPLIWTDNNSKIDLDLVDLQGQASDPDANGVGIVATAGGYISLLGGNFNQHGDTDKGPTAIMAFGHLNRLDYRRSQVDVKGYTDGTLNIKTGDKNGHGIFAFGDSKVQINSEEHAGFVTTIHTDYNSDNNPTSDYALHGIAAGFLGGGSKNSPSNTNKQGRTTYAQYAGSEIIVNGEIHIITVDAPSYGLSMMGDGNKIIFSSVTGQNEASSIHSSGTAIKFSYADGYALKYNTSNKVTGEQLIELD